MITDILYLKCVQVLLDQSQSGETCYLLAYNEKWKLDEIRGWLELDLTTEGIFRIFYLNSIRQIEVAPEKLKEFESKANYILTLDLVSNRYIGKNGLRIPGISNTDDNLQKTNR